MDECGPQATALLGTDTACPCPPRHLVPHCGATAPSPLRQARGLAALSPQLHGPRPVSTRPLTGQCQGLPSQPLPVATRSRLTPGSRRAGRTVTQAHTARSTAASPNPPAGPREAITLSRVMSGRWAAVSLPSLSRSEMGSDAS